MAAATLNLLIYLVGRAAAISFVVPGRTAGSPPMDIGALQVVLLTGVLILIGTAVAVFADRRGRLRLVRRLGGAFALLSLLAPMSLNVDVSTKLLLLAMHIVAGGAFVVAVHRVSVVAELDEQSSAESQSRAA